MPRRFNPRLTPDGRALLNLGCGARMSHAWNNLDFSPYAKLRHRPLLARFLKSVGLLAPYRYDTLQTIDPQIIVWDLRNGIPFAGGTFDAIYHSHFLEHLDRGAARGVLAESYRALKPGGVTRVVVPDLAAIIARYNAGKEALDRGGPSAASAHEQAITDIFDQMVRAEHAGTTRQRPLVRRIERLLRGNAARTGELHRWMYDRHSLARLLESLGYRDIRAESPTGSRIKDFASYHLDADPDGTIHKIESIYIEGVK